MDNKMNISTLSDRILRFIYIYRCKYVAITEIEAEFNLFSSAADIIADINHLATINYINIVKTSGVVVESISTLDENVFLHITSSGIKKLLLN